jgi:prepilin-type N-terminal cleavage/methylation domain-containing protein
VVRTPSRGHLRGSTARREPRAHASRPRNGLTLVELLVALLVLTVGVLALAGTAAQLARAEARAAATARAAAAIDERVERVAAAPCTDDAGTRQVDGLDERWRTWSADGTAWLADTVRWTVVGGVQSAGIAQAARCRW